LYLGGKISEVVLPNDVRAYSFSPTQYVKEAVLNIENYLDKYNYELSSKKVNIPIPADYHPELYSTPELNQKESKYIFVNRNFEVDCGIGET